MVQEKTTDVEYVEQVSPDADALMTSSKALHESAKAGNHLEHNLGTWEATKMYKKAIGWSLLVAMCVIMEGFDMSLISASYGFPSFQHKYGTFFPGVGFQLTGPWQIALSDASGIGSFFGVFANGWLTERYGHRKILLVSLVFMAGFIFITFFAPNKGVLLAGEILVGFPWGVFATVAPNCAAEFLPTSLRVYMTSFTNMSFVIGQLISAGVFEAFVNDDNKTAYRIPFAVQWAWPVPLFIGIMFAPDSPWWLVRKGRLEDARKSLKRLTSKDFPEEDLENTLALMIHTNNLEIELNEGTTYLDCFKGVDLRRTEICCVTFACQNMCGSAFANGATYFFEQAGLSPDQAYKINVGQTALGLVSTVCSWFFLMPYFGRRKIYLTGFVIMTILLLLIGCLDFPAAKHHSAAWGQVAFVLCWQVTFQATAGQLGWAIPSETSSTRLRQKTICLARNAYYITSIIAGVIEPYMINPTDWDWKGKTGFFWSGSTFIATVWIYFRLTESRGRTYEELDLLFAKKVPARQFAKYQLGSFDEWEHLDEA